MAETLTREHMLGVAVGTLLSLGVLAAGSYTVENSAAKAHTRLEVSVASDPLAEDWAKITTTTSSTTTLPPTIRERIPHNRVSRSSSSIYALQPKFWIALAMCESEMMQVDSDPNDSFHSFYQWQISTKWNTWRAAGGTGMPEEHSFEEQTERAKHWASITDPTKQWRDCWPIALKSK